VAAGDSRSIRAELARLPDPALRDALIERLRAAVAEAARGPPEDVRVDWVDPDPLPLWLAVESYVARNFGFPLLPFDLPHCHSIVELASHLAAELRLPPAPTAPMGELYRQGWSAAAWPERRYDAPIERPIVFVLSAPRSGSTLLSAMLGKHPRLYAAGELSLLPFETMGARQRHFGWDGVWLRLGLIAAMRELTGMTREQAETECQALEAQDIAVSVVYRRLQALAGNRIVVDKSPFYASDPAWLAPAERVFRAARYIHLTRQPEAVIESFVRMRFHRLLPSGGPVADENPWLFAEKVWTSWNLHCRHFLREIEPSRQLRISYEALVTDPAAAVAGICDFLEIPFDDAPMHLYSGGKFRVLGMGDPGLLGHTGIDPRLASDWRTAKPPQDLSPITREVAETLGYSID
jgi:sulfotransferase family protein